MPTANIHRRDSIERVYPSDAFASDAAQNWQVTNQVVHGVRVLTAPNASGDFDFERAAHHVGEPASSTFLTPYRHEGRPISAERDSPAIQETRPDPDAEYEGFLTDIVAVARQFGFEPEKSPGRDEPRLRGLRQ
jgi:hypothetical protein